MVQSKIENEYFAVRNLQINDFLFLPEYFHSNSYKNWHLDLFIRPTDIDMDRLTV